MPKKTYIPADEARPASPDRRHVGGAGVHDSGTARRRRGKLHAQALTGPVDGVLKKVMEEAGETALAAKGRGGVGDVVVGGRPCA